VGQRVRGPHRDDAKGDAGSSNHLQNIVHCAIPSAGEDGVTALRHGLASLLGRIRTGLREDETCFNPGLSQNLLNFLEIRFPLFPSSTGSCVVEESRLPHASESLAAPPLPHAKHRFLGQWMAGLAGQHSDLPAMVSIMSDQVAEEGNYIGLEAFHSTVPLKGALYQCE